MNTRHHYLSLLRTFALATLTAAAVTACTDDNGDPAGSEPITPADGIPVTFTANINPGSDAAPAGAPDTRTVLEPTQEGGFTVKWKGTDSPDGNHDWITIWAVDALATADNSSSRAYAPTTSDVSSALTPVYESKITLPSAGNWKFIAIYGHNSTDINCKGIAYIPSLTQSAPGDTKHIAAKDFSVATTTKHVEAGDMPDIGLQFKHKLSALQLQIKNGTGEELTVREIRLSVTEGQITIKKYYSGITEKWISEGEKTSDYLPLKITNPAALANDGTVQKFHMLLFPGYENKTLTITVITDRGEYTLTKGAPTGGFLAGKNYLTDITITSTPGTGETWTEYVDISNAAQLAALRNNVNNGTDNYGGKIVRLLNDITLTGTWTPIGTGFRKSFQGTFDGGGHLISNLSVDYGNNNNAGLFGYVYNKGTVRNLRVSGTVTATGLNVGGIVGYLDGSSTVENCIFSGKVEGKEVVGGIVGNCADNSRIAGCHSNGSVTATSGVKAGGIARQNQATIDGCYSSATVSSPTKANVGGIAGGNENGTITHCYATGTISATYDVGGIVGNNYNGTVENCIALNSSLERTEGSETTFGRIVGNKRNGIVTSCAAFDGMKIKDASSSFTGTGEAGTALTSSQCLAKTTYTDRGFTEATAITAGWAFDSKTTWTYLPWNSAFASFSGIQPADYRIEKAFTQP